MRKAICGHLKSGIDFVEDIELAKNSPHLMSTSFYAHISIDPSGPGAPTLDKGIQDSSQGESACH